MGMFLLWCGAVLFAWMIVSQIIAGLIASKPENIQMLWVGVFLAPVIIPMIALAFFHQWLERQAQRSGLPVTPKDNPMDYLP